MMVAQDGNSKDDYKGQFQNLVLSELMGKAEPTESVNEVNVRSERED